MDSTIFHNLTVFHAIAAEGSITGAARRLEMGVPAISKSLKGLEARAGLPLFHRTTRKLEITEAGQMLRERTQDAVRQLDYAFESVRDLGQTPSGNVRITTARFAYQWVLRPVLAGFYHAYPHIQLEISISDGTIDMIAQGFDLGIRFGDRLEEGMVARRLMPAVREGLYVSSAYVERHGMPSTPQDLRSHHLIGYRFITANRMLPLILDQEGDDLAVDMPSCIVTNDIEVIADATRQGLGIGRLFEPIHETLPDREAFLPVLERYWRTYPQLYLYFPKNSQRAKRIRAVIDYLVEHRAYGER